MRLDDADRTWRKAGVATGRVAHRLAAYRDLILVIGGAAGGDNLGFIETLPAGQ